VKHNKGIEISHKSFYWHVPENSFHPLLQKAKGKIVGQPGKDRNNWPTKTLLFTGSQGKKFIWKWSLFQIRMKDLQLKYRIIREKSKKENSGRKDMVLRKCLSGQI